MNSLEIENTNLKNQVKRLEEIVEMQRGWVNILRMDIKNLLNAETTEEFGAAKNCLASSLKTYAGENH